MVSNNLRKIKTKRRNHYTQVNDYDEGYPDIISTRSNLLGLRSKQLVGKHSVSSIKEDEVDRGLDESRSPSIDVHPTIDPLQSLEDVVTHVGGSLVVVGSQRVTILCEASGEEPIKYQWFKDEVQIQEDQRLFLLQDGSLRLFQPQYTDAGRYMCIASNRFGNDSRTTVISVTNKPKIMSTVNQLEDFVSNDLTVTIGSHIRARLGARIVIQCPTEGFPEPYVEWRKDGPGLQRNSRILYDNSLEINPTNKADQGQFSCEATNPFGSSYQASSLVLIDPPHTSADKKVALDSKDMQGLPELLNTDDHTPGYRVKANSSVIMGCPLTGFPEPKIVWYFEGEDISNFSEQLDFQLMYNNKVLQISRINNNLTGIYSCKGVNDGGEHNISLQLNITVYTYIVEGLTECNESCGGSGTQQKRLYCIEDSVRKVEDWYCTGVTKPNLPFIPCNRVDCPPSFYAAPWSKCSVDCGSGNRTRLITCVILMADGSMREVSNTQCAIEMPMPVEVEACYQVPCPKWQASEWRKCSKKCLGNGTSLQSRSVDCVAHNGSLVHKSFCKSLEKPLKKRNCSNPKCKPVWKPGSWSVCSASCGRGGFQTRILGCYFQGRPHQNAGRLCSADDRPNVSKPCNRRPCRMRCRDRARLCRRAVVNRIQICYNYKRKCCRTCS